MRRFRHGLPPTGTQKPRRKNGEKSGTPNGSTGLLGFPMERINTGKAKKQQQRHRITHNQKYNLLLEALEKKWSVLSKRSKGSDRFYPRQNHPRFAHVCFLGVVGCQPLLLLTNRFLCARNSFEI
ncbi:hypothetical protein Zmor_018229 [Zophobas morio]|uniref:Uncharacterized protein n=1 Tax=Zophobas morio TaxID=2755281 RepID=A0AA38IB59_9CUCU|nr:hypothetical protein Zmor_018229 [Zophobas morio]